MAYIIKVNRYAYPDKNKDIYLKEMELQEDLMHVVVKFTHIEKEAERFCDNDRALRSATFCDNFFGTPEIIKVPGYFER